MIVAVVGSGGKTTYIKEQAKKYVAEGKRVLVTTTTHMYAEPETVFTNDAQEICICLQTKGYCMAGRRSKEQCTDGRTKICALSPEAFRAASQCADIVLVEADGAKGLPVKFPAAYEPVIPEGTETIVVVMGFFAAGERIRSVCHRPELVCGCLGVSMEHRLTQEDLQTLVEEGYRKPLARLYPTAEIMIKKSL